MDRNWISINRMQWNWICVAQYRKSNISHKRVNVSVRLCAILAAPKTKTDCQIAKTKIAVHVKILCSARWINYIEQCTFQIFNWKRIANSAITITVKIKIEPNLNCIYFIAVGCTVFYGILFATRNIESHLIQIEVRS